MRGTALYGPRNVRFEDGEDPRIEKPTDAIIRICATCVWIGSIVLNLKFAP
jgi:threonine dehydrogenase-like Zn-dependent dehydrogenase